MPQAGLVILDPTWTVNGITANHGYYVFDTLYGVDANMQVRPQMAEGQEISSDGREWRIRLRTGLLFHDGAPVCARDCVASLQRWASRDILGKLIAERGVSWEAKGDLDIHITLDKPFPALADALGKFASPAFIVPERLALESPDGPVRAIIGSGPYRFLEDEFVAGSRAAYQRFEGYKPRQEKPLWSSGGKVANVDRIEWLAMPDPATAASSLTSGEVDWWQFATPDLLQHLKNVEHVVTRVTDRYGFYALLRFNCLTPPFNNKDIRKAVASSIDEDRFMSAIYGQDRQSYRTCDSMFPCEPEMGAGDARSPGSKVTIEQAREIIRGSGYAGEKVVILTPYDISHINAIGQLAADHLEKLGMVVTLESMDWATIVQRRASIAPVESGGWSIFPNDAPSVLLRNPLTNPFVRGIGKAGWFGWYENVDVEKLIGSWVDATTEDNRRRITAAIDRLLLESPAFAPVGQYLTTTAFRSDINGILEASYALPWNVYRA